MYIIVYGNDNNCKLLYKDIFISNNDALILNILYQTTVHAFSTSYIKQRCTHSPHLISNNGAHILNILYQTTVHTFSTSYIIRSVLLSKAFVITQLRRHSLTVHLRLTSVDGYKKRTTCLIGQELVARQVRVKLGLLLTTPLAQVCPLM